MPYLSQPKLISNCTDRTLEFHKKVNNTGVDAVD